MTDSLTKAAQAALEAMERHPDNSRWSFRLATEELRTALAAQQAKPVLRQGGMSNDELRAAWDKKLHCEPKGQELSAFAVGIEVGFAHAQDLERQDWSRVHHVLKKHGVHPGRTDDHLADVIDKALAQQAAQPVAWQPIDTATKDGNRVLIFNQAGGSGKRVMEAAWSIHNERTEGGIWRTPNGPWGRGFPVQPDCVTHWMPLPPAPDAAAQPQQDADAGEQK